MIKEYLSKLIKDSYEQNNKNILSLVETNPLGQFVDLGCDNGDWTLELAKKSVAKAVGVEIVDERLFDARKKGIEAVKADLSLSLPFESETFDFVHANQVIEHLYDTDEFVSEIKRVLKPNGYAIVSTENLSSWHNIFALILGFQPFSMANFSKFGTIGNPLSLWNNTPSTNLAFNSWQHRRLFSYFGLKDLFVKHGFKVEKVLTSGYYPLPLDLAKIDMIHGHWITLKVRK